MNRTIRVDFINHTDVEWVRGGEYFEAGEYKDEKYKSIKITPRNMETENGKKPENIIYSNTDWIVGEVWHF